MARKEQITITLDPELVARLRETAQKRSQSLSSVIEAYLMSVDAFSGKTDIQRVLEVLDEIKGALDTKDE